MSLGEFDAAEHNAKSEALQGPVRNAEAALSGNGHKDMASKHVVVGKRDFIGKFKYFAASVVLVFLYALYSDGECCTCPQTSLVPVTCLLLPAWLNC